MLNRKIVIFAFEKYEKVGLIKIFQILQDLYVEDYRPIINVLTCYILENFWFLKILRLNVFLL